MEQKYQDFFNKYNGKGKIGNTVENKGQCVGLVSIWSDTFNIPHTWGNACDLYANADSNYYDKIPNTPTGIPIVGDIIIWSSEYNDGPGHTGIATGKGNIDTFDCFQQNDPTGSVSHNKTYNYNFVTGWLRIRSIKKEEVTLESTKFVELVSKSTEIDKLLANGFKNTDEVVSLVKELKDENTGLKLQISQVNSDNASTLTKYKSKLEEDATAIDAGLKAQADFLQLKHILNTICDALEVPQEASMTQILTQIATLQEPVEKIVDKVNPIMEEMFNNLTEQKIETLIEWLQIGYNIFIHKLIWKGGK